MTLSPFAFTAITWASVALVATVFLYEMYAVLRDMGVVDKTPNEPLSSDRS